MYINIDEILMFVQKKKKGSLIWSLGRNLFFDGVLY